MNPVIQSPCYVNSSIALGSFEAWMEANRETVEDYFEELEPQEGDGCTLDEFAKSQYQTALIQQEYRMAFARFYSWQERDADAAGVPLTGEIP